MVDQEFLTTENAELRHPSVLVGEFGWIWLGGLVLLLLGLWPVIFGGVLPGWLRPFRVLLGVIYVLYIPGYCLTGALFPQRRDLDGVERIGLHLGLSVAMVPLPALLLNALPVGIRLETVLPGVLGMVLLFSGITIWRRSRLRCGEAFAPKWQPRQWWYQFSPGEHWLWQMAGVLLLGIFAAVVWTFTVPAEDEWMTEFYMLGESGLAEGFVRETAVFTDTAVTIGIANHERTVQTYRIEVWVIDAWADSQTQVLVMPDIQLAPGDSVEQPLIWQMPAVGTDQQVAILLFTAANAGETVPYRRLKLWINVTE